MLRVAITVAALSLSTLASAGEVPEDFPRFVVPGCEKEMESLRALYWLHYQPAGPLIPLWDEWIPMSTLWPARGDGRASGRDDDALGRRPWHRAK